MQINIAINNTIIIVRVKEVCKSVKYHNDNVGKNLTTPPIKEEKKFIKKNSLKVAQIKGKSLRSNPLKVALRSS